nr:uncharacterized protein LOC129264097 [Lytechinus pictus]
MAEEEGCVPLSNDYDRCEEDPDAGPSTSAGGGGGGSSGETTEHGAAGTSRSCLQTEQRAGMLKEEGSSSGTNGEKKGHRVTIKDTNPTYHRSASGGTKPKDVIISVREKHGSFRAAVPCMPTPVALICCLLNIVAPGTGESNSAILDHIHIYNLFHIYIFNIGAFMVVALAVSPRKKKVESLIIQIFLCLDKVIV